MFVVHVEFFDNLSFLRDKSLTAIIGNATTAKQKENAV